MFAFLIFDCTFAHLLTRPTKHRPRSSVKKFDFSAYALIFHRQHGWESKGVVFTNS